jgi:molybdopterin/thiamine biosynthesis adenylyltransferase
MRPESSVSPISIRLKGTAIPGAEDRQKLIPGWDQEAYSKASLVCIGAGGIISHIAPALCRKGIGKIVLLDRDIVEVSNLNRQRFYPKDIGKNKALALAENLLPECITATEICGYALNLEDAIERRIDLDCDVAICGVDNNPARVAASRFFRLAGIPVIFAAVSRDGDHGYVFVQEKRGACIGCVFPDMADDDRYPCPGTPAIADVLQLMGSVAGYAIDSLMTSRQRSWNYRRFSLAGTVGDGAGFIADRGSCQVFRR